MTYVDNSWTQLAYWEEATGYGSSVAQVRLIAYSTQDIATNKSTIHWKWQKSVTGGSAYWNDSHNYSVSCGSSASWTFALGSQSSTAWTDVGGEKTTTVTHNDNGTKSVDWSCSGYKYWSYVEASGTIELPTIARASSPTVTPNPQTWSNTSSNTITVATNRKSSSFTHTVRVDLWGYQEQKTGVEASTTFAIPYSTLASMPYYKSFTGSVYTQTKNGSTNVGSEVRSTWTVNIDTSIEHPTVESITLEDTNAKSAAVEAQGSFISNASNLRVTIALGVAGSYTELNEATVVCGNVSQTYVLSGTSQTIVFEQEGLTADNLKVIVTDARGTTVTETRTWNLIPYVSLTALGQVRRTSEIGDEVRISVTGRCFAGDFGQASNVITVKMKSKLHTASDYPSTWTTLGTVTPSGDGETTFTFETLRTGYDYDQQYDFIFYVEDLFTSAESSEVIVTTGIPVYGNGADFFAVYGDSFLHWDRTNPSKFWNINDALNGIMAHGAQKNLAIYDPKTVTVQGITYHVYVNGGVRITGTATGYSSCNVGAFMAVDGVEYILNGCPEGGGSRTYSVGVGSVHDYGEGATVTGNGLQNIYIDVFAGETVDLAIYPMVRDARIANEDFETPLLFTRYFTSGGVTVNANSSASTNITITVPGGYRVLAILRSWTNGDILTNYISTSTQSLQQGQTSVTALVRNPKSSASNVTVSVEVLFIRA